MGESTTQSEVAPLQRVVVKHPRDALLSVDKIQEEWADLGYPAPPDLAGAIAEFEDFVGLLDENGAEVLFLPPDPALSMDSMYSRDASIQTDRGMIYCRMGKEARRGEPHAQRASAAAWGIPTVGEILPPGTIEGGDVVWLAPDVLAVGRGYRSNQDGIRQLIELIDDGIDVVQVDLPHWRGPGDVFHLMSILSPLDHDLALVYSPLLPVPFRERLLHMGFGLIEVPPEEYDSLGCNVLSVGPRRCLMVEGNPRTRARIEEAGVGVQVFAGREICLKGSGGPTCLTRPVARGGR